MMTISVSDLKSHLSAELKKVQDGAVLTVLDHRHPIARLVPLEGKDLVLREPAEKYTYTPVEPLISHDILDSLQEDRQDRC